ncbi:NUDIX domain-containing protein [Gordonia sp. NB41Y]|uniref:NUDIX hydrolase n=1 Tax=Gordonia sp. NB41Y TaxID=875808 RepID=UPI0006B14C54|nr:NUDIX domain-containing protein [Gordonia sp. NB41Y]KOY48994.1 NUDIX hydrolase [Gordonia sp. NB41Y]WLP90041.1 NUDIX domain-containing protein [Gordonia sp. NB41Y]
MSTVSLHASAVELLTGWAAPNAEQDSLRHAYLAFLAAAPDACLRASEPGHLTASAIVFDADRTHVLLTLHPRVGRWVQLGGHCEPDDTDIAVAARREAREESGIADLELTGAIARLHTHPITCSLGVPTRHLDVQFAVVAPPTADGSLPAIERSSESVDLRWWPVDGLPDDADLDTLPALIELGLAT